jgi:hypothetical protein
VKSVELRCTAGGWNHAAKKDNVRPLSANLIHHLVIIQAEGAAVQNPNICSSLLADKSRDL